MKITLITACFNAVETIGDAIDSVRRQRLPTGVELEHLVVDGASSDGTIEIIRRHADDQVGAKDRGQESAGYAFRWISEKDEGLYDALNKGIRMATGDIIGICNADDVVAEDETVLKIAKAFENRAEGTGSGEQDGGVDAVYADVRFVRGGEGVDGLRQASIVRYCTGRLFRNWMFRFATFPAHPSTFVRRKCFEKYGLYSLDYRICADFELMLRLFYKGGIRTRYLPICTHVMRLGGVSTDGLRANVRINREDLRALRANGVWSCLPLVYLKYFAKIWGFVRRRG